MMDFNRHMSTGGWIFSILGTLILIGLVVGVILWLVSTLRNSATTGQASGPSAREILDRRLASGELTIEQHQQLRETIKDGHSPTSSERPPPPPAAAPG
jgi:uncharacterized membrane protein